MGDGKPISIAHTGFTKLNVASNSLMLRNVLHAPSISRNIISISQFCKDNNVVVQFSSNSFCVKDILSGKILLRGPLKQGIYEILSTSPVAFINHVTPTYNVLHHRFGHPSFSILKQMCSRIDISVSKEQVCTCISCNVNKMHKFSFSISTISSTAPFYIYIYRLVDISCCVI